MKLSNETKERRERRKEIYSKKAMMLEAETRFNSLDETTKKGIITQNFKRLQAGLPLTLPLHIIRKRIKIRLQSESNKEYNKKYMRKWRKLNKVKTKKYIKRRLKKIKSNPELYEKIKLRTKIQYRIKHPLATKICPLCNSEFKQNNIAQIYCSKKCKRKNMNMKR